MPRDTNGKNPRRCEVHRGYTQREARSRWMRAASAGLQDSPYCFALRSFRFALQDFSLRCRKAVDRYLPAQLQRPDISNDGPAVARHDPVAVRIHHAKPIRDDVEKMSGGRRAQMV